MKIFQKIDISEKSSGVFLWFFIGIYVALFSFICFLKYTSFAYNDYDLAYFDQIVWNILHGSVYSSILGMVFLGVHVQTIWFIIAPFYFLFPHPVTLLVFQSLALGAAAYPLYLLAKRVLGYKWGLLISSIYLVYPAVGYLNLFELHSTAFAPLFLFSMFYFFHKERFALFMLFLFLAVSCQENIALVALGMGFYALCKRRGLKWVLVPVVAAGVYFLLCLKVIMPYFNNDTIQFIFLYRHLGDSPFQIVANLWKNPIQTARIIMAPHKMIYLIQLLGPLSFISLFSPLWLLAAFPMFAQHFLSSRVSQVMIQYHYTAEIIPFIFVAFVFGIKNLLRFRWFKQLRLFIGIFLLLVSLGFTYVVGPYFQLFRLAKSNYSKDEYDRYKESLLKIIPPDASVVATFEFLSHLTHRRELYSFHHHYMGRYTLSNRTYRLPDTVRYALLDFNDSLTFSSFYLSDGYKNIQELLGRGKWGAVEARDTTVLFIKDAPDKYEIYRTLSEEPQPRYKIRAIVDDDVAFLGFDIVDVTRHLFHIAFYWESLRPTQKDIRIFLHFVDEAGKIRHEVVRPVCYGIYPTNAWAPGERIREDAYLTIPSGLLSGKYEIFIGFYDYRTGTGFYVDPRDALGRVFMTRVMIQ